MQNLFKHHLKWGKAENKIRSANERQKAKVKNDRYKKTTKKTENQEAENQLTQNFGGFFVSFRFLLHFLLHWIIKMSRRSVLEGKSLRKSRKKSGKEKFSVIT